MSTTPQRIEALLPDGRLPSRAVAHVRELVPDSDLLVLLAEQTAADAERAAQVAKTVGQISGLTGEDDAVALLFGTQSATRQAADAIYPRKVLADLTVNIPSDYPTMQAAVDALAPAVVATGRAVTLLIEAGHQPAVGLAVANGDFSRFVIKSAEPEVLVADGFTGDFIRATEAKAPRLGTVVNMRDMGEDGYALWRGSQGHVNEWCGVKNAGQRGLYATDNCTVFALRSVFTGSGNRNVWITRASTLDAELANFSANKGGENAVYISRASSANIQGCDITGAYRNAVTITRSTATINDSDLSNAGLRGLVTDSTVFARNVTIRNAVNVGVSADQAARVTLRDSIINGCGSHGVISQGSSVVELSGTSVTNSGGYDLTVVRAGVINAFNVRTTASVDANPVVSNTNVSAFNAPGRSGTIWA